MGVLEWTTILGNVGEFVGAAAVVVTLVYLAAQIRQNTVAMEASRKLAMAQGARDVNLASSNWHLELARDPELKRIVHKAQQLELQPYTDEEWYEFRMVAFSIMMQGQALWAQRAFDVSYDEQIDTWLKAMRSVIDSFPAFGRFWEIAKEEENLEPGFIAALEATSGRSNMSSVLYGSINP